MAPFTRTLFAALAAAYAFARICAAGSPAMLTGGGGVDDGVGVDAGTGVGAGVDEVTVVPLVAGSDPPQPVARTAIRTATAPAAVRVVGICSSPQTRTVRYVLSD
jgi:hypothetical protein